MKKENRKAPELRFPEFKDSGDWDERKVKDVFDVTRGKVIAKTSVANIKDKDNIYPVYSSQTLNRGIMGYLTEFMFEGNFLTWTTDGANAGDVNLRTGKFNCTNVCGLLVEKEEYKGFANTLTALMLKRVTPKHVSYVGNPKLMNNVMSDIKFCIPQIEEQTKIATFFTALDKKIELIEKKIDLLESQKKGYMQKIFSQELRFTDENGEAYGDWVEKRLGDVLVESKETVKDFNGDKQLTVRLHCGGVQGRKVKGSESNSFTSLCIRHGGEFIYGKQNFHNGAIGIIPNDLDGHFTSSDIPSFKILEDLNSIYFLNYWSQEHNYKNVEKYTTGTGSKRLHQDMFLSFKMMMPAIEEQTKIANFLSKLDSELEKYKLLLDREKELKKGMMQKMFV